MTDTRTRKARGRWWAGWAGVCWFLLTALSNAPARADDPHTIFDGKTFAGWEGDTRTSWRIEDGAILGGSLEKTVPRNEFLATEKEYEDFELTLKYRIAGTEGFINGGVQFRSKRIPGSHEVSGYQADLGMGRDGNLYDESRRRKALATPPEATRTKALKPGDWNEYRIRVEGPRVRLWLNDVLTVDYTEADPAIPRKGIVALQIHGGCKAIVRFKDIKIQNLGGTGPSVSRLGPRPPRPEPDRSQSPAR